MFGSGAVDELQQQKQVLVLESSLNRLKLQAELQNLRSIASPLSGLAGRAEGLFPWLMILAPVAGFFAFRSLRRSDSLPGRLATAVKLILPLYQLWQRFSSAPRMRSASAERGDSNIGAAQS